MRKPIKYEIVTKCCQGAVYKLYRKMHCQLCHKPATFYRKEVGTKLTIKEPIRVQTQFNEYKPARMMSVADRADEAIKRRQIVEEYALLKPTDSTETKFIKQRIKWNNDRIALLLG